MGKTTLAQLVYNDEKVQKNFDKMWWACISDILEEKEVTGKIFQSVTNQKAYRDSTMDQLESEIRKTVSGSGKFLLVLDDLWDENHSRGQKLRALLGNCAKGSKIIVTTRYDSVASAMDAAHIHPLEGLSEEMSWRLFKRLAFRPGQEEEQTRERIGKEILLKCANVPLAITAIANILFTNNSIREWEFLKDNEISQIEKGEKGIMSALKLSYNHLPSELKHCFAYCSLFPKDYRIYKDKLIQLWISQGYVHVESSNGRQTLEDVGHMYFMKLFRMSFFQEVHEISGGEILSCKMHDLVHDLAELVAGEETARLTPQTDKFAAPIRHLALDCRIDESKMSMLSLPDVKQLRSLLKFRILSLDLPTADQLFTQFRCLRALDLSDLDIEKVSSSVGELIHLRYLNLSGSNFTDLPDSITKLLNLHTLDISWCSRLESLPNDFRKLINLRHLRNSGCRCLRYMPLGFEELTSLQRLDYFKVGKVTDGGKSSRLDVLAGMELRGELMIEYEIEMALPVGRSSNFIVGKCCGLDALAGLKRRGELKTEYKSDDDDWYGDAISLVLEKLETLAIWYYPGMAIRSLPTNLVHLGLEGCKRVKHLPTLRCFPHLKSLILRKMYELEYVEEDEEKNIGVTGAAADSNSLFFPCLETLVLRRLPKLKGWSSSKGTAVEQQEEEEQHSFSTCSRPPPPPHHMPSFPLLTKLSIQHCPELQSMPLSPRLQTLDLENIKAAIVIKQVVSASTSSSLEIERLKKW